MSFTERDFFASELRPKIFKAISAYRNMDFDNDKMIENLTNDLLLIYIQSQLSRLDEQEK